MSPTLDTLFFAAHQPAHSPQRKEHCGGIEPHLHKPHFPDMLLTMPLPVMGSVSWSNGQAINLAPIRTYLSVSAHARVWCWLTESNRRHPAYKAGALPAELNQQSGGTGRIRTFDHSVNSRTHNRCASDPEMKKPKVLTSGLNFFASERLNGFPALEMNLTSFSGNCNSHFPQKYIFIENTHHLVTRERMTSAYDSCL